MTFFIGWKDLVFIAIVALGIVLPMLALLLNVPLKLRTLRLLTLAILAIIATVASWTAHALTGADTGTMFVRSFLIDGISIYILTVSHHRDEA